MTAGGPRAFVGQFDLAEVRKAGGPDWLPQTGVLFAFFGQDRYGYSDLVEVLHTQAAASERPPPQNLRRELRFAERRVGYLKLSSVPSLEWMNEPITEIDVSPEELDALSTPDEPSGDGLQHRIDGYPSEIQGGCLRLECERLARGLPELAVGGEDEVALERASRSWRLLLQVDTDPALGMNWGDGGRLYVFVREQHARAGDFSQTITISQSH